MLCEPLLTVKVSRPEECATLTTGDQELSGLHSGVDCALPCINLHSYHLNVGHENEIKNRIGTHDHEPP